MNRIKPLYKLFEVYKKEQVTLLILIISQTLITTASIYCIKYLIDAITQKKEWNSVVFIGSIILLLYVVNIVLQITQHYKWHILRYQSINYLRSKMLHSTLQKAYDYFTNKPTGEILAKVMDDSVIVAQHASTGLPMLVANIFQLVVVIMALFFLSYKLVFIVLATLPIYFFCFNFLNKKIRVSSSQERNGYSKVMQDIQEKLQGIHTIKIFKKERYMVKLFDKVLDNYFVSVKKNLILNSIGSGLTITIMSILPVITLLIGGYLVYHDQISLGSLIAFYTFLSLIYEPVTNLSDYNLGLQTTLGMAERVLNHLDEKADNHQETIEIDTIHSIEFRNVSFEYGDHKRILSDISLTINKGDRVCIIGSSGSGKSTILNLLMKFHIPQSGSVLINGSSLESIKRDSYYNHLTLLQQSSFLFHGTIKENITLGEVVEYQRLQDIAHVACLADLINSYDSQFEYMINESASNISGGEKQRICLARALARNAEMILLDEASSSLDAVAEKEMVKNLHEFVLEEGKTLIAISHRPEILSICNKIIHIEKGVVMNVFNNDQATNLDIYELISGL